MVVVIASKSNVPYPNIPTPEFGRFPQLDFIQFVFFVNVDQYATSDGVPQARTLDLARLKHYITVSQQYHLTPLTQLLQYGQCTWVESIFKWIVQ